MALENLMRRGPAVKQRIPLRLQSRESVKTANGLHRHRVRRSAHLPQWGEIVHAPRQKSYAAWRRQI
jgi:hypothetical protein